MAHKILRDEPCPHCDGTGTITRIVFDPPIVIEVDEDNSYSD